MKNKLIILSISLVTISNCTTPPSRPEPVQKYVCNCKESMELKSFIQNSIKNANNMSDEEMEDVIEQLEETGVRTICHTETVMIHNDRYTSARIDESEKIDSCRKIMLHYY